MTTQPEALRLAEHLKFPAHCPNEYVMRMQAAEELLRLHAENERLTTLLADVGQVEAELTEKSDAVRRLHAVNQELLEALRWIERRCPAQLLLQDLHRIHMEAAHDAGACARAAIAKATGEQT